jgi:hypothetical protein
MLKPLQWRCEFTQTTPLSIARHELRGGLTRGIASSRPLQARLSPLRLSPRIPLIMSSPRSRTRRAFPRINNVWSSPESNLRMAALFQTTTSRRYEFAASKWVRSLMLENVIGIRMRRKQGHNSGLIGMFYRNRLSTWSSVSVVVSSSHRSRLLPPSSTAIRWSAESATYVSQGVSWDLTRRLIRNRPVSLPVLPTAERRNAATPTNSDQRRS